MSEPNDIGSAWQTVQVAANDFVEALAIWVQQVAVALGPVVEGMYAVCRAQYIAAGAPYGESDDGMLRWVREVSKAHQLQAEAEYLLEQHRSLVELRQKVSKRT